MEVPVINPISDSQMPTISSYTDQAEPSQILFESSPQSRGSADGDSRTNDTSAQADDLASQTSRNLNIWSDYLEYYHFRNTLKAQIIFVGQVQVPVHGEENFKLTSAQVYRDYRNGECFAIASCAFLSLLWCASEFRTLERKMTIYL